MLTYNYQKVLKKYPYPPQGSLREIPRRKGTSKANTFKGKYEAKIEFLGEWSGFMLKHFTGKG